MGFSIAIAACKASDKTSFLQAAGLTETEEADRLNETLLSAAESGDQYLVWRDWRKTKGFGDPDYAAMSKSVPFTVLDVNETSMVAMSRRYEDGREVWSVTGHEDGLQIEGPAPFDADRVAAGYKANLEQLEMDTEFSPPVEEDPFGQSVQFWVELTGFRYDGVYDLPFVALAGEMPGKTRRADGDGKPWWKIW